MKLYGIKIDKNEKGEETALVELTRVEISNLMCCANAAALYQESKGYTATEMLSNEIWMELYKIKFSELWKNNE